MKWVFYLLFILTLNPVNAQEVVKWHVSYSEQQKSIEIKASIQDGWHLYSQHIENNVGPVPTSFSFKSSDDFLLKGGVIEPKPIKKYDENFEATLDFFEHEALFIQEIEALKPTSLDLTITYMVCNETMCLPPVDYKYKLDINL